jgi:hypothetical protein
MKQVTIRVTRKSQVLVTQTVEVVISRDTDSPYPTATALAKDLVEAQIAAGQPVPWFTVSSEIQSYPSPTITAEPVEKSDHSNQALAQQQAEHV